jgi:uncharacterized phiE125 gp8 family phage protein
MPVSLNECKRNGVIDHDDDDILINQLIQAAVSHLDGFQGILGRCMVTQTWTVDQARFDRSFVLPVPNVTQVEIRYRDTSEVQQTLPANVIFHHPVSLGTCVMIDSDANLPEVSDKGIAPITVAFTAGFGAATAVPWALKLAVMQLVRQLYDDRGGMGAIEAGSMVRNLIAPYRWVRV